MKKPLLLAILFVTIAAVIGGVLIDHGYLWLNNPDSRKYPVRGLDVSNHQGVIDWPKVRRQGYQFVYIKATEGRDYRDRFFAANWKGAAAAGLQRGAYHFFTFGSPGVEQARHLIATVPRKNHGLPVVIDLEFGGNSRQVPGRTALRKELDGFIALIETYYRQKPILYLTYDSYERYIRGAYPEYRIWIRDVIMLPHLPERRAWTFWQFCNRGRVDGIKGPVDLNVFCGDNGELERLLNK